jgi:uncharacterized cupin superfamily protein
MSRNIIRMAEDDLARPTHGPEPAGAAVEGTPTETTHEYYDSDGATTGVWECTPGRVVEDQQWDEFGTILSGRLELIDNADGSREVFAAGDSFFLPKGSTLTWIVHETVRKYYMTAE